MNRRKINRITLLLLALGWGSALGIFLTAEPESDDGLVSDFRSSKRFHRELQVIGGKGNVLAADFQDWFAGLWHGQELAGTVAVLTVGVILAYRFVATHPDSAPGASGETTKTPPPGSA